MSHKFGMRRRPGVDLRQQMIFLGGGALAVSALTLVATVLYTDKEAEAHVKVVPQDSIDTMLTHIRILVPSQKIEEGVKLSNLNLKEVSWPRNEVPDGALRQGEELGELYAKGALAAGQPILRGNLSNSPPLGSVADLIKPGYRAVTIEVDATSGVEGWATAGAHVDVIVTFQDPGDGMKKSQVAIEDAVVLSYNRSMERGSKDAATDMIGRYASTATVTLSVPVVDAVKLHTARAMGQISLVLRSADDVKGIGPTTVTPADFQASRPAPAKEEKNLRGMAKFTDHNGVVRELELRGDKTWTPSGLMGDS